MLAQLGITAQKPLWRAYPQDPERVRKWVQEEVPAMAQEARQLRAETWFGDESGYHPGTTWGRKGETPVVRKAGPRYRLNLLRAANRRGKMRFMIEPGKLNADVVCRFLDRLMEGSLGSIFLILDGYPLPKPAKVAAEIQRFQGRLRVYLLPPYSPELNDEGVWRKVKSHRVGRAEVFSFADIKLEARSVMHPLAGRPDEIRAFFRAQSTLYAT